MQLSLDWSVSSFMFSEVKNCFVHGMRRIIVIVQQDSTFRSFSPIFFKDVGQSNSDIPLHVNCQTKKRNKFFAHAPRIPIVLVCCHLQTPKQKIQQS